MLFEAQILKHCEQNQDYEMTLLVVRDSECKVFHKSKYHSKFTL